MINGKDIVTRGFHKAMCDLCQRATWHYKTADHTAANCSNHSDLKPGRKHVRVEDSTMVIAKLTKDHGEAPNERELRIVNRLDTKLWERHAERKRTQVVITNEDWAQDLFAGHVEVVRDPDKLYCSFCGDQVDHIASTTEKKATIRPSTDVFKNADGDIEIRERIMAKVQEVHACPNCVAEIRKPIVVRRV